MDETEANVAAQLGNAVTAWMRHAGVTILTMHKRTGIGRQTLYAIQQGKTLARIDVLERIAAEVGTTAGSLVDGVMPPAAADGTESPSRDARLAIGGTVLTEELAMIRGRLDALEEWRRTLEVPTQKRSAQ